MDQMKGTVSKGKRHTFQFICFLLSLLQILLLENESSSEWAERTERNMKDM